MKSLKIADLFMQVMLFCAGMIYMFVPSHGSVNFFCVYYWVGGWQLFSCLVHWIGKKNLIMYDQRVNYGKTMLWLLGIGLICFALIWVEVPAIIFYLGALLFISPVFAVWYFMICLRELDLIKNRELVHLK
jgi:hypothetical protein